MKQNSKYLHLPLVIAITLAAGIGVGATVFGHKSSGDAAAANLARMREILSYIQHDYVDTVDAGDISRYAIEGMLERLDPHSSYVAPSEVDLANSQLEGDFNGIGIEFVIQKDSVEIVSALSGGPSDKAGLRPGDRIVRVGREILVGPNATSERVFQLLRGSRNSKVDLEIARTGLPRPLQVTVVRDRIPTKSVDAAIMLDHRTGFIKISRFTETTDAEFTAALKQLKKQNMHRLVLDLRDNPGGYLDKAIKVADEFLPEGKTIVETRGKHRKYDSRYKATEKGSFEDKALVVLLDEGSASAAEILAGALQDNDRATIVGRRSYGKGLVQMPIPLSDGGELRLTISRYYTPSGRCIQKPYQAGHSTDYEADLDNRYQHGEFFNEDSIHYSDTVKYHTKGGRVVYGGGGIKPDVFVPFDSASNNALLTELYANYVLQNLATDYARQIKSNKVKWALAHFKNHFKLPESCEDRIQVLARREKIAWSPRQWKQCRPLAMAAVRAMTARALYGENGYWSIATETDAELDRAMEVFGSSLAVR